MSYAPRGCTSLCTQQPHGFPAMSLIGITCCNQVVCRLFLFPIEVTTDSKDVHTVHGGQRVSATVNLTANHLHEGCQITTNGNGS